MVCRIVPKNTISSENIAALGADFYDLCRSIAVEIGEEVDFGPVMTLAALVKGALAMHKADFITFTDYVGIINSSWELVARRIEEENHAAGTGEAIFVILNKYKLNLRTGFFAFKGEGEVLGRL